MARKSSAKTAKSLFASLLGCVDLEIPEGITEIKPFAYKGGVDLRTVTIPHTVTKIADYAFQGCDYLLEFSVSAKNAHYCEEYGNLYSKDKSVLVRMLPLWDEECVISDTVIDIAHGAFEGCRLLTRIQIPESVERIGDFAFERCSSLEQITISANVEKIGKKAFQGCEALERIIVSEDNSFYSDGGCGVLYDKRETTLIRVPQGTRELDLPLGLIDIAPDAFEGCTKLDCILCTDEQVSILKEAISGCVPRPVIHIVDGPIAYAEDKSSLYVIDEDVEALSVLPGVKTIDGDVFKNCTKLTALEIPESVTYIDPDAFRSCPKLTIHAPTGSYAEAYCREKGIVFVPTEKD